MWKPKYIKHTLIGKTLLAVFVYLFIFLSSLAIYKYVMVHETCEKQDNITMLVSKTFSSIMKKKVIYPLLILTLS